MCELKKEFDKSHRELREKQNEHDERLIKLEFISSSVNKVLWVIAGAVILGVVNSLMGLILK